LLLCAVLVSVLWRDAVGEHLVKGSLSDDDVRTITRKLTPSMASYMAFIAVGLFAPELALLGYLLVALFIMLPLGALRRSSYTS
jgi:multisubunit Na+/H+ antiporter MnhB subunit